MTNLTGIAATSKICGSVATDVVPVPGPGMVASSLILSDVLLAITPLIVTVPGAAIAVLAPPEAMVPPLVKTAVPVPAIVLSFNVMGLGELVAPPEKLTVTAAVPFNETQWRGENVTFGTTEDGPLPPPLNVGQLLFSPMQIYPAGDGRLIKLSSISSEPTPTPLTSPLLLTVVIALLVLAQLYGVAL